MIIYCDIVCKLQKNQHINRCVFLSCLILQVIFSACELGVFDLLLRSQEPVSARHVAQELSTSVDGMERLLDALVGIEILEVETKDGTGEGQGAWGG